MEHYSVIIRAERKKAGLSIRALASRLGISEGHLRYIETAVRPTKPATLLLIATILKIDDRPLMEAWFLENMPSVNYTDISSFLPKGLDISQLEDMYQIKEAERVLMDLEQITATGAKDLNPKKVFQMRGALRNCLGMIKELGTPQRG